MHTIVADIVASIWCYDVADGVPLRQIYFSLISEMLNKTSSHM